MNGNHDVEMNGVTKTDDDDGVVVLTAGHSSTPSPTSTATTLHIHPPPPLHSLPTSEEAHNTYHPDFMFCGACTQCEDDDEGDAPVQTTPEGRVWTASVDVEVGSDPTSTGALVRTQLMVPTMTTESQSHVVETLLKELSGVHRVTSNILTHMVDVDHGASTTLQEMVEVLQKMGFQGARPPSNNSGSNQLEMPLARSQFHVQGICCTSECPTIQSIVEQLPSVSKIQINITTKNVYVEYDPHVVSAMEIAHSLTKQGFKSRILKDGAVPKQKAPEVGRTTLHMTKALVPNDIPKIQQRLACVQGVKRVGVNLVESVVFCEHDVSKVSAKQLSQHLAETEGSGTTSTSNGEYLNSIAADAMDEITQRTTTALTMARSKFVESTLLISNLSLNHLRVLEKSLRQNYVSSQLRAFYPHVPSKTVKLEHNPELLQANQVCGVLQRYGMEASVAIDGSEENLALPLLEDYESDAVHPKVHGNMIREDHASMHYNVWLSGIFWALSLVSYGGGNYLDYFKYCGLFSVLFGIPPIALKAYRTIRRCQFDANCMMVVAAVGALALGEFDEAKH
uniref:HMA domain-containing protein n=1 Tax=Grammatophora oceanica TaxID=210454 RepID=A0A7S1V5S7_9STRA|mmetsp:Transcript_3734/g.5084  ORF Transcript_3734/g.5084 Transcript_3734/m.5084 type:complete len:566 (+) Transcript_3734:116-1813(+)